MFGAYMPRARKLKQMCQQLDIECEQDGDGTVHCQFNTSAGLGLVTLSAESDGMLYVVGGTLATCPPHRIPEGLGEFLVARSECLPNFGWRAKNHRGRLRLTLVGVFAFSDVNAMALASILNQVAGEVGEVADILAGRGILHA